MSEQIIPELAAHWFAGDGEMRSRIRSFDWSSTPIGPIKSWPSSLRTTVSLLLASRYPMTLIWGDDLIQFYNDGYMQLLGAKHPDALGRPHRETFPEVLETVGPMIRQVMTTGVPIWEPEQLLVLDRQGYPEECYFTLSYSPVQDDAGQIAGMLCVCSETTEKVLSERRLRLLRDLAAKTSEARTVEAACRDITTAIASYASDVSFALIYLRGIDDNQLTLQSAVRLASGQSESPTCVDLEQPLSCPWPLAKAVKGETVLVESLEPYQLSGGTWDDPTHSALVLPILSSNQKQPVGVLVAGISPRLALDESYHSFLELLTGQIAIAIANAQAYEQERRKAEELAELDRAKTIFLSNISHEFRTPLTLMLGPLTDTLAHCQEILPAADREQLKMAYRNGLRLLKLVNTLLDFSRIEANRVQANYQPTDLSQFTAELTSVFRAAIEKAGLQLIVDCPPLSEPVYVDRQMWEKIVFNLLSNAFKFTFSGAIAVSLKAKADSVQLQVNDTGIGIPAAALPHLFERFYRVERSRGRSYEGSGIGLSLVQELVQLHGGAIAVESAIDQGTTFTITLPTGCVHLPPEQVNQLSTLSSTALSSASYVEEALQWLPSKPERISLSQAPEIQQQVTVSARILLVDDNVDMRTYVQRLLRDRSNASVGVSYQVEAVEDGLKALDRIYKWRPDLILTDIMMPGMDGFQLLQELRSDPQTQDIPVILLSARAGETARIEGLEAGAHDYLIKPFSARELLARIEANLQLSHSRQAATYRQVSTILESITDAFVSLDQEWRYVYVNQEAERLLQKQRAQLLGNTVWQAFPDLVNSPFEFGLRQAVEQQMTIEMEEFYPPLDIWIEIRAYPSANGLSIYFRDVTQRKQLEQERTQLVNDLQEINVLLDTLINNAPIGIAIWDEQLRYVRLNDALAEINGLPKAAHLGKTVAELLPGVSPEVMQAMQHVVNTGEAILSQEASGQTPAVPGKLRYWLVSYYPIRLSSRITWVGAICEEITDRKQAESEREQLLDRERIARTEAEAANRIKDEFLAVLSHELRTPLNPILGWARLLQTGRLTPEKTAIALETIERNAKLQTQLIEDLLDVSRILQGKLKLNKQSVDLTATIKAAVETVRLAAEAKSIQINLELRNVSQVMGDANRLQQVFWNLLSNAVKFTPASGQITVRLNLVNSQAQVQVQDTGRGISPDFLPYVFDTFRQADGSTTRQFGGLGLGLAIARHIVEMHGGTVQAQSLGEEKGATFTVYLPRSNTHSATYGNEPRLNETPDLSGLAILVVEDEPDTRELVAFILTGAGANVTTAASAEEALKLFRQAPPQLLVCDIGMPGMDGYQLIQQVRVGLNHPSAQIPAIALTAYAGEAPQQQAIDAGFQAHLSKPVEPMTLVRTIVQLVSDGNKS